MAETTLIISSRNYSSWSLRGWLLARMSGLPFAVEVLDPKDPASREELLLKSSSTLVPCLMHEGFAIWDTLAIAEYLNELCPQAGMYPTDRQARARCRSVAAEMHAGFSALRASLPMNLRAHRPGFPLWSAPRIDIERICTIWRDCLAAHGGPWLFGERPSVADAFFTPVATRFVTYDVKLDEVCAGYRDRAMAQPDLRSWIAGARLEEDEVIELEVDF